MTRARLGNVARIKVMAESPVQVTTAPAPPSRSANAPASLLAFVSRPETGTTARTAALRALEALGDARALDAALRATADADAGVATAAVAVARAFL